MNSAFVVTIASLVLALVYAGKKDGTFFLKPIAGKTGEEISVTLIQGASCAPVQYYDLAVAMQQASSFRMWVAVPEFIDNTPEPAQFGSKVHSVEDKMRKAGMNATHSVFVAHSLGGVMTQIYASGTHDHDAIVLMGATILRSHREKGFGVPVLTLDGELDGLLRITRQAEAYFHEVLPSGASKAVTSGNPVVILAGLDHWSFASGDANPPPNVKKNDIKAEKTAKEGHAEIASTISNFLDTHFAASASAQSSAAANLTAAVQSTGTILAPILKAMQQEGHHELTEPCNSDFPTNPTCQYPKWPDKSLGPPAKKPKHLPPANCVCGSAWVASNAQSILANLSGSCNPTATITTKDTFHDVSDVKPFHLPHIFSPAPGLACQSGAACAITSSDLSMPVYDSKDKLDTGLYPITATEIRTKLKSRQAVWEKAGCTSVDYDSTDRNNVHACKAINQASWDWAMSVASADAKARMQKSGRPLVMGDDVWEGIGPTGPKWIGSALQFQPSANNSFVTVNAPYFSTVNKNLGNESYLETIGYHYCKILSPARAIEWIYIDSLKPQ